MVSDSLRNVLLLHQVSLIFKNLIEESHSFNNDFFSLPGKYYHNEIQFIGIQCFKLVTFSMEMLIIVSISVHQSVKELFLCVLKNWTNFFD